MNIPLPFQFPGVDRQVIHMLRGFLHHGMQGVVLFHHHVGGRTELPGVAIVVVGEDEGIVILTLVILVKIFGITDPVYAYPRTLRHNRVKYIAS